MDQARADWALEVDTHRVIRGRRWRVSDPRIPERLRQTLVDELMAARRAVKVATDAAAERAARRRVHQAKVALGERGLAWWRRELDATDLVERIEHAGAALACAGVEPGQLVSLVAAVTSRPEREVAGVLRAEDR